MATSRGLVASLGTGRANRVTGFRSRLGTLLTTVGRYTANLFRSPRLVLRTAAPSADEHWHELLALVPNYICIIDRQGKIRYVNRAFPGRGRDHLVGRRVIDFAMGTDREAAQATIEAVFATGEAAHYEGPAEGPDGTVAWYAVQLGPVKRRGRVVGVTLVAQDITARKSFEDSMRALVLGTAAVTGADFFRTAVRQLARALGVRATFATEFVGDPPTLGRTLAVWSGDGYRDNCDYRIAGTPAEQVLLRGEMYHCERHLCECFPALAPLLPGPSFESYLAVPFHSSAGAVIGLLGVVDDRPMPDDGHKQAVLRVFAARAGAELDRLRTEAALRESEQRFRRVFEDGPFGMAFIGPDYRIVRANERLADMLGYTAEEMVGLDTCDVVHRDDRGADRKPGDQLFAGTIPSFQIEPRARRKDGTTFWCRVTASAIRNAAGASAYALAIIEDVTDRREAEREAAAARDQALAAARAKSDFLANVSHELRTPMNGVLGALDLLLGSDLTPEQRDCARLGESCAKAQLGLIDDILDFSRIEAGLFTLRPEPADLIGLVEEVATVLGVEALGKCLTLSVGWGPRVPRHVLVDPKCIRQPLMNLVGNAIKFTTRGSVCITVLATPVSTSDRVSLRIEVRDTGIGIPTDKQSIIFERFTQVDSSSTRRYGGTGLGLAISKQLVEAAGGRIGVSSRPGEGSTFWFALEAPIAAAPATARPPATAPRPPSPRAVRTGHLRVLLVEDNVLNQRVAARMLERLGCRVDVARTGHEAVTLAMPGAYDLVFMDCLMPEMDGFEATAAIRQAEGPRLRVPIVAMTALASEADRDRCLGAGMDAYILKPVTADALESILRRLSPGRQAATG